MTEENKPFNPFNKGDIAATPTPSAPIANPDNNPGEVKASDSADGSVDRDSVPHETSGASISNDDQSPKRLDDRGRDISAQDVREARYKIEQEQFLDREQEYYDADPLDTALMGPDGRAFDRGTIKEAFETDQFVRDGNILYPAPLERPVGAGPSFVGEVLEVLQTSEEDVRARSDSAKGIDPHDRSDKELLERANNR
jgi:hypothetical protein